MITHLASREAGDKSPSQRWFGQQFSRSISNLHRLERQHTLQGHEGCVNTLAFDDSGDILLSGSDDLNIILWNWRAGYELHRYQSGHTSNVFQARALPNTNTSIIVTCARDGHVRKGLLHPSGGSVPTVSLATHRHAAHKLALDPQHPSCFLSCGEDAAILRYDARAPRPVTWRMVCKFPSVADSSIVGPKALYSIHCNPVRPHQFGVSGRDPRVAIFDSRMVGDAHPMPLLLLKPPHLGPGFSMWGEVLVTYNDEDAYLFGHPATTGQRKPTVQAQHRYSVDSHDGRRRRRRMRVDTSDEDIADACAEDAPIACFRGQRNSQTIKGISFLGHSHEYVVSGSDCGHAYIWGKGRPDHLEAWLDADTHVVNCLEPHPHEGLTLATSGIDDDIKVWAPTAEEPVVPGRMAEQCMRRNLQQQGDERPIRQDMSEAFRFLIMNRELFMQWTDGQEEDDDEDEDDVSQ